MSPNKDSNISPRPVVHMYHDSKAAERVESQSTSRNSCVSHDSQHENVAWYSSKKLHDVDANFEINANQSVMSHFVRERVPLGYLEQPQVSQASANVSELSVNIQSNARRTIYGQSNQKSVEPVTCEQNFAEQQGVSHESGYRNSNVHGWVINKESEQREPHDSLSSHERSRRSQYEREHREPPDSLSSHDRSRKLQYESEHREPRDSHSSHDRSRKSQYESEQREPRDSLSSHGRSRKLQYESEHREPHDSHSSHDRSRKSQYESEHREPRDSLSSHDRTRKSTV